MSRRRALVIKWSKRENDWEVAWPDGRPGKATAGYILGILTKEPHTGERTATHPGGRRATASDRHRRAGASRHRHEGHPDHAASEGDDPMMDELLVEKLEIEEKVRASVRDQLKRIGWHADVPFNEAWIAYLKGGMTAALMQMDEKRFDPDVVESKGVACMILRRLPLDDEMVFSPFPAQARQEIAVAEQKKLVDEALDLLVSS